MKLIPVGNGRFAKVDDEDFYWLNQWKWQSIKIGEKYYAFRSRRNNHLGLSCRAYLHRIVMRVEDPKIIIDHIYHDGLDCQKINLREATHQQNCWNKRSKGGSSSKYLGVSFCKDRKLWSASLKCGGIKINIGRFNNEEDAAKAYDIVAKENFGEFANLNFKSSIMETLDNIKNRNIRIHTLSEIGKLSMQEGRKKFGYKRSGKKVVDILTGEIYNSLGEVSKLSNITISKLSRNLCSTINNTNYKYL